jgi:hypothetical protein
MDGILESESKAALEAHLRGCVACARKEKEYLLISNALKTEAAGQPLPYFWERLQPKLRKERKFALLVLWEQWCLKAIPVFLIAVGIVLGSLFFVLPRDKGEMTQSEILLLQNDNPLTETRPLFDEEKPEARQMMLIFASVGDQNTSGRKLP